MHGYRTYSAAAVAVMAAAGITLAAVAPTTAADRARGTLGRDATAVHGAGSVGVLAQARRGRRVWSARAGVAVRGSGRPVPYRGYFRIGSVTKTFVATAALQLVAAHRLSLDDTVDRWLPGVVHGNGNDGRRITVRELLQHTSGVPDNMADLPAFTSEAGWRANRFRRYRPAQLVALAMRHKPVFPPGTSWSYSNTDYILVDMIIEKVTGRGWASAVRRGIIGPLHLRHTFAPGAGDPYLPRPHADGYYQFSPGGALVDTTVTNYSAAGSAGDMVSTTGDLSRFLRALLAGRLLPAAQLAQLKRTVPAGHGARYGLGLQWRPLPCGGGVWGHDGDVLGYSVQDGVSADGRRSVVLAMTTGWADDAADDAQTGAARDLVDHAMCSGS